MNRGDLGFVSHGQSGGCDTSGATMPQICEETHRSDYFVLEFKRCVTDGTEGITSPLSDGGNTHRQTQTADLGARLTWHQRSPLPQRWHVCPLHWVF